MTLLYTTQQGKKPNTRPTKQTNYSNAFSVLSRERAGVRRALYSADTVILKGRARQSENEELPEFRFVSGPDRDWQLRNGAMT